MKTVINNTTGVVTYKLGDKIILESTSGIEIKGDLTIAGTTTTNARVDDQLLELGYGTDGSADGDAGIIIERGDDDNVFFGWDESADMFTVGTGTFTGTTTGDLSLTPGDISVRSITSTSLTGSNTLTIPAGGLIIGSTAVTATAAELNAVAGGGLDSTELGYLNAVTAGTAAASKALVLDSNLGITGIVSLTSTAFVGDLTGDCSGTAATVTTAAQPLITSLGTLSQLIVDFVSIDAKTISMIGSVNDTAKFTVGTNGTLDIITSDLVGADANITITADGTFEAIGTTITLDSGGAINLEPAADSAILLDGTISVDAGVVTGATSITSTAFLGALTGNVSGNCSGTAATVTGAAQTAITSVGTLSALAIAGNLTVDTNTLFVDSSANEVGIGTTSPGATFDVRGGHMILTDGDVSHGITNVAPTEAYGDFGPIHGTRGGLMINGLSDQESADARSLTLRGICNDTHTDTVPTVELIGAKRSGSSIQALAAAETVLQVSNHTTQLLTVLGGGSVGIGTASPSANANLTLEGGSLALKETTTPTADTDYGKIYTKADNKLYFQDGAGNEHEIAFA